ncbi:hypothetical protein GY45DRAFT_1373149 [Cubamyces sp. BRFM 1775]|nr:hypothetical protein GY45DRAFT_1373149 [Cubamyces sp. BRFM 1775]
MSFPQPVSSAPESSAQPATQTDPSIPNLADLRQLTLENGRIIDLPFSILREPAPKPIEFLHLQHYFEGKDGVSVDLSKCESADEAIDVLADEIEAIRLLLYGYVVNFKRYVDRFEEAHEKIREQINGVRESYDGLSKLVTPAYRAAMSVEGQFFDLEERINRLPAPVATVPKPPRLYRGPRGGLKNPPLSTEENQTILARQRLRNEERAAIHGVIEAADKLVDAAILKDVFDPPRPEPQPEKEAAAPRKKHAFTHELSLKINKVTEGVQEARKLLSTAQTVTMHELAVLRYREDEMEDNAKELWKWHETAESLTRTAGMVSDMNQRRIDSYHKWAAGCEEAIASAADSAAAQDEPAAPAESDNATDAHATATTYNNGTADASAPSPPPPSIPVANHVRAPSLDGDLYALVMNLSCTKPYDELTREEAIDVLKSLPLRVHFVPYVGPEPPTDSDITCNGADVTVDADAEKVTNDDALVQKLQVADESASEKACPSPAAKAAGVDPGLATSSPVTPEREQCSTKPRSRKRARPDDDLESCSSPRGVDTSPCPAVEGSPTKKKRGGSV